MGQEEEGEEEREKQMEPERGLEWEEILKANGEGSLHNGVSGLQFLTRILCSGNFFFIPKRYGKDVQKYFSGPTPSKSEVESVVGWLT